MNIYSFLKIKKYETNYLYIINTVIFKYFYVRMFKIRNRA
ncbi:hypothetical protein TRIP_D390116 [uncultured Paludibacter sp.]|nr:hypothetical protein TRIP_D390116 [uncultured Paludibacter sp.]